MVIGNLLSQKFYFEYQKGGYYKITAMHTGKSLTAKDGIIEEGTNLVQCDYQGLDSQKWIFSDSKIKGWVISSYVNPQLSITVNGNIVNGSKIILSRNENNDKQMLYLYDITSKENVKANGIYKLAVGKNPSKTMNVYDRSIENNAIIDIDEYTNISSQKFYFEYQSAGYYKISSMDTGKCLTVLDNKIESGTSIVQDDYKEENGQKWLMIDSNINGWIIASFTNPQLVVTINGSIENGSKLILSQKYNNDKQMFYTYNLNKVERVKEDGLFNLAIGADATKSFEILGASRENNSKIGIGIYREYEYQKFNIEYIDGYYKITSKYTGKSLTVQNNKIKEGTYIVQDEYRNENSQKWLLRDSKINGWVISSFANPQLSITVEGNITNGAQLILSKTVDSNNQMLYMYNLKKVVNLDSNRYPGISDKINQLAIQHPNWEFEILYTTIDFNTAVQSEYEYAGKRGNLVYTPSYKGDWIAPAPYVSGVWASASYKGIAYFMDARNFLNDKDIFQFVDLSNYESAGATLESIQYQVNGTFLQSYAEDFRSVCERVGINPYYALARLFQEQGIDGSATIYMNGGDGNLYFNPFNIGAEVGNDVETALARAKRDGWNTMAKGLEGGIRIIRSYYLDVQQNTLYLNKFDVNPASGGGFYNHQYMQNLSAAYSEASILRDTYEESNILDNKIKFIIPVYENMPRSVSERPNGNITVLDNNIEVNCNDRVYVKTSDGSGTNVRTGAGTNYSIIRAVSDNTRGTRVSTGKYYGSGYWWDYVCFDDGTQGYVATNFLRKIN